MNEHFNKMYDKIRPTLMSAYESEYEDKIKSSELSSDDALLRYSYMMFKGSSITLDSITDEELEQFKSEETSKIFEFLVLTGVYGYFSHTNMEQDDLNEKFLIAYSGAFDVLKNVLFEANLNDTNMADTKINANFFSVARKCSQSDYLSKDKYMIDIGLVTKFLNPKIEMSKDVYEVTEGAFFNVIEQAVDAIRKAYTKILEPTYGIQEAEGIFTFEDTYSVKWVKNDTICNVEPHFQLDNYFTAQLSNHGVFLDTVHLNKSRTFDVKTIVEYATDSSKSDKSLYFPYKMIEILSKHKYAVSGEYSQSYPNNLETSGIKSTVSDMTYQSLKTDYKKNVKAYLDYLCPTDNTIKKRDANIKADNEAISLYEMALSNKGEMSDTNKILFKSKYGKGIDELTETDEGLLRKNLEKLNKNISNSKDFDSYSKLNMRYELVKFCWLLTSDILEREGVLPQKGIQEANNRSDIEQRYIQFMETPSTERDQLEGKIAPYVHYFVESVTCCCVLYAITVKKADKRGMLDSVTSYRIRAVKRSDMSGAVVFGGEEGMFERGIYYATYKQDMPSEKVAQISSGEVESIKDCYKVFYKDFNYVDNVKLVEGRPLFALKALDRLKEQDITPSYTNMMLGKAKDGSIVYLKSEGQPVRLHHLWAGSRSGKGVMGYNIFATAIGNRIPIFYMDRKPDTSCVFKDLSNGAIFSINGGQYDGKFDPTGVYTAQSGKSGRVDYIVPDYLKNTLIAQNSEKMGDFAYYRGMLLTFEIVAALDSDTTQCSARVRNVIETLRGMMGQQSTIIMVLDEFTNFCDKFANEFNFTSEMNLLALPDGGIKTWKTMTREKKMQLKQVQVLSQALESADAKNKGSKEAQLAKQQAKAEDTLEELKGFRLNGLYYAQLIEQMRDFPKFISELLKSGGKYIKQLQIYLIGQRVIADAKSFDEKNIVIPNAQNAKSGRRYNSSETKSYNLIYNTIASYFSSSMDFFLGYNMDAGIGKGATLGMQTEGMPTNTTLTSEARYFAYVKATPDDVPKISNTVAECGGVDKAKAYLREKNVKLFKPFLILNAGDSLDENEQGTITSTQDALFAARGEGSPHQYIGQCVNYANLAGVTYDDIYNDVPSKTEPPERKQLDRRIGFADYIQDMYSDDSWKTSMGISGEMANYYVKEMYGYVGTPGHEAEEFCRDFRPEYMLNRMRLKSKCEDIEGSIKESLALTFFNENITYDNSFAETFAEYLSPLMLSLYNVGENEDDAISKEDLDAYDEDDVNAMAEYYASMEEDSDEDTETTKEDTTEESQEDYDDEFDVEEQSEFEYESEGADDEEYEPEDEFNDSDYEDDDSDYDDSDEGYSELYADEDDYEDNDYDFDETATKNTTGFKLTYDEQAEISGLVTEIALKLRPDLVATAEGRRQIANLVSSYIKRILNGDTELYAMFKEEMR